MVCVFIRIGGSIILHGGKIVSSTHLCRFWASPRGEFQEIPEFFIVEFNVHRKDPVPCLIRPVLYPPDPGVILLPPSSMLSHHPSRIALLGFVPSVSLPRSELPSFTGWYCRRQHRARGAFPRHLSPWSEFLGYPPGFPPFPSLLAKGQPGEFLFSGGGIHSTYWYWTDHSSRSPHSLCFAWRSHVPGISPRLPDFPGQVPSHRQFVFHRCIIRKSPFSRKSTTSPNLCGSCSAMVMSQVGGMFHHGFFEVPSPCD